MTIFNDGPAQGQKLMLKRAPFFLRVVRDGNGKFDALDQLDDSPAPGERLFAYVIIGLPGSCHVRAAGNRGGFFVMANYGVANPQPDDATMRDQDAWSSWCEANAERFGFTERAASLRALRPSMP